MNKFSLHISHYISRYILVLVFALGLAMPVAMRGAKPDFDKIQKTVTDPQSKYYWPKLQKKYAGNDTTMTDDEYHHLYYGFMFQPQYEPYEHTQLPEQREIEYLYRKDKRQSFESKRIIEYAQRVLQRNPFDLIQLNYMVVALDEMGKVNLSKIWKSKLAHLLKVIAASGTGADKDNAWYVIYPKHEYDFLNLNSISATGQEFIEPHYDYISVQPKQGSTVKGYYFDILPVLEQYYAKHPDELEK